METLSFSIDQSVVNEQLAALAAFSDAPAPAVTRILWSETDMLARAYVKQLCAEAGLTVREDGVGNFFARWNGSDPSLPPVVSGSHIDAIPNAGRYDGTVGVLGALEAICALQRAGFEPTRSIELLLFTAEEPTRFGIGCLGSRALAGTLTPEQMVLLRDKDGHEFESLRKAAGLSTYNLADVRLNPGTIAAFVELHIEQGPILEAHAIPIGIVEHIAAPAGLRIRLEGEGGHAGAVLMPDRHDALLAGAEIALAVEHAALETGSPDTVTTTGVLTLAPGAINSIPAQATLEIDIRDIVAEPRDQALGSIKRAIQTICERRGIRWSIDILNADPPATCDPALVETVAQVCETQGTPYMRMISRAYHDTLFMARLCPVTMIFIPCKEGISHRPDEHAHSAHIQTGIEILAHTLARLTA